ncbi:MAG: hypothetical protein NTX79_05975 [Candidatus Micrarchaeota archaeon]|nr:hypothetical protein [Candidatus Micrarchaeota archaeon]
MAGVANFKVVDVPYEKGSITPRLAAVHFYKRLPLISKVYPMLADKNKWVDGKPAISKVTPVFVKMISGMSMAPLGERIEKDGKRRFLTSKCNDKIGTWRLEIPEKFLTAENLGKEYLLFAVENGVYTVKEGKNEWSSLLENDHDMRLLKLSHPGSIKMGTWEGDLFRGIERDFVVTLHMGYKIDEYGSFVNMATAGSSYMMSETNPHRNVNLNPKMSIAYGTIEITG